MKYTVKSVNNITKLEIDKFVRRYNATATRMMRQYPHLDLWETMPKITYLDIVQDKYTFSDAEGNRITRRKDVSNREVARRLNQYSQLFEKENQKVVKFGEVQTLQYVKKVAQQEQKRDYSRAKRRQTKTDEELAEAGTTRSEEKPLKAIKPTSQKGLAKSVEVRRNRSNVARNAFMSELYKANYFQAVRNQLGAKWVPVFEEMLRGVSGKRMAKIYKEDDTLSIDWIYTEAEITSTANRILSTWAEYLGREYEPPEWAS